MSKTVLFDRQNLQKTVRELKTIRMRVDGLIDMFTELLKHPPHDDGSSGGEFFAVIRWHENDVKEALAGKGYKVNRENINRVLESRTGRTGLLKIEQLKMVGK